MPEIKSKTAIDSHKDDKLDFLNPKNTLFIEIFKYITILIVAQYLKEIGSGTKPFDNFALYGILCYVIGIIIYYKIVKNIIT